MTDRDEPSLKELAASLSRNHRFQAHRSWRRILRPGPPGALSTDEPQEWEIARWHPFLDDGEHIIWLGRRLGVALTFVPRCYAVTNRRALIMGGLAYEYCRSIALGPETRIEVANGHLVLDRRTGGGVMMKTGFLTSLLLKSPLRLMDDPQDFAAGDFMFEAVAEPDAVADLIRQIANTA